MSYYATTRVLKSKRLFSTWKSEKKKKKGYSGISSRLNVKITRHANTRHPPRVSQTTPPDRIHDAATSSTPSTERALPAIYPVPALNNNTSNRVNSTIGLLHLYGRFPARVRGDGNINPRVCGGGGGGDDQRNIRRHNVS